MNRDDIYELLDDYLDGYLDPATERRVREGLSRFPELQQEADRRRDLTSALAGLPHSIDPPPGLWGGIVRRLDEAQSRSPFAGRALLLAASLALFFLAVGYLVGRLDVLAPGGAPGGTLPGPAAVPVSLDASAPHSVVSEAERALLEAKAELRRAVELRRPKLPPETQRLVDRNLSIVEQAIADIRAAIAADPGNPELNLILVGYHEHEIELLRQVARASERL